MENPKCPYCGEDMRYYWNNNPMKPGGWFFCPKCHSQAPTAKTDNEAYAAAMKRDGAKGKAEGKWIWDTHEGWECRCSRCGEPLPILTDSNDGFVCKANYCPNCGAEIKEIIDE